MRAKSATGVPADSAKFRRVVCRVTAMPSGPCRIAVTPVPDSVSVWRVFSDSTAGAVKRDSLAFPRRAVRRAVVRLWVLLIRRVIRKRASAFARRMSGSWRVISASRCFGELRLGKVKIFQYLLQYLVSAFDWSIQFLFFFDLLYRKLWWLIDWLVMNEITLIELFVWLFDLFIHLFISFWS